MPKKTTAAAGSTSDGRQKVRLFGPTCSIPFDYGMIAPTAAAPALHTWSGVFQ